ncbi:murein transglycosylase A [Caulobacter henricii]|uniref:peptidoglycan lytic exotransglycosylase n=1 Tax=Caulobacter henricii TaxID=69395 RepID=A0A0P0P437_9CAUL|nr:MltA domain-containing protein [Caulobacter henricii]ALL15085.1 transglycosylase [Caulobacter henricii]
MLQNGLIAVAAALTLAACATTTPTPVATGPVAPPVLPGASPTPASANPVPTLQALAFGTLAGWTEEDHLAALDAFRAGCGVAREPDMARVCRLARTDGPRDELGARLFLEANFRPQAVGDQGLLTAYFAPKYEARLSRSDEFSAPVRGLPADLVMLDLGAFEPSLAGKKVSGRVRAGKFEPYPDRKAIEASPADKPLAWMRPEELFFLQIQGSGVLVTPDGRRQRAAFAGGNGKPFVGIATAMRDRGLLTDNNTSGDAIRTWLADNRGPRADEIMQLNPRYIFFKLSDDDGQEAVGSAGIPLPAGRAIAVDPSRHAMGGLYWLDAAAPKLAGAFPAYRRLAVALDVGGAIKGEVRADLYTGSGPTAGIEAGRVRHDLRMYRLVPIPKS